MSESGNAQQRICQWRTVWRGLSDSSTSAQPRFPAGESRVQASPAGNGSHGCPQVSQFSTFPLRPAGCPKSEPTTAFHLAPVSYCTSQSAMTLPRMEVSARASLHCPPCPPHPVSILGSPARKSRTAYAWIGALRPAPHGRHPGWRLGASDRRLRRIRGLHARAISADAGSAIAAHRAVFPCGVARCHRPTCHGGRGSRHAAAHGFASACVRTGGPGCHRCHPTSHAPRRRRPRRPSQPRPLNRHRRLTQHPRRRRRRRLCSHR